MAIDLSNKFLGQIITLLVFWLFLNPIFVPVVSQSSPESIIKSTNLIKDYEFYWLTLNKDANYKIRNGLSDIPIGESLTIEQVLAMPERKVVIRNTKNGFEYQYFEDGKKINKQELAQDWTSSIMKIILPYQEDEFLPDPAVLHMPTVGSWGDNLFDEHTGITHIGLSRYLHSESEHYGLPLLAVGGFRLPGEKYMLSNIAYNYYFVKNLDFDETEYAAELKQFFNNYDITEPVKVIIAKIIAEFKNDDLRADLTKQLEAEPDSEMVFYYPPAPEARDYIPATGGFYYTAIGEYVLAKDASFIKPLADGNYFIIESAFKSLARKLIISNHSDKITSRYLEDDIETSLPDDFDDWYRQALVKLTDNFIKNGLTTDYEKGLKSWVRNASQSLKELINAGSYVRGPLYVRGFDIGDYPTPYSFRREDDAHEVLSYVYIPAKADAPFFTYGGEFLASNKDFHDYVENDNAKVYSLHHEQWSLGFGRRSSNPLYKDLLRQHFFDAVDYYSGFGKAGFDYLYLWLNQMPYDDVLADILDRLEPKLPQDNLEIMQKFAALKEAVQKSQYLSN